MEQNENNQTGAAVSPKGGSGIVTGLIIILVLIAFGFYVFGGFGGSSRVDDTDVVDDDDSMVDDDDFMTDEEVMIEEDINQAVEDNMIEASLNAALGAYGPYSTAKIALAEAGNVVLFFRASWCPTCRALDADIKAHSADIPKDLAILDVDFDNSKELRQKYGVTIQHTLVQVDAKGELINKWSGSPTLAELVGKIK